MMKIINWYLTYNWNGITGHSTEGHVLSIDHALFHSFREKGFGPWQLIQMWKERPIMEFHWIGNNQFV